MHTIDMSFGFACLMLGKRYSSKWCFFHDDLHAMESQSVKNHLQPEGQET